MSIEVVVIIFMLGLVIGLVVGISLAHPTIMR